MAFVLLASALAPAPRSFIHPGKPSSTQERRQKNTDALVVLDNGAEIRTVGISGAPYAWQFTLVRIGRADAGSPTCGPDTGRGRYVMRCEGFEGTPGDPPTYSSVLPLFVLDVAADGTMTGRHFARDHPESGFAVTGKQVVSEDCTMRSTMTTGALPGATIEAAGVYFGNGKEAFAGPILALFGGEPVPGAFGGFACRMTRLAK